LIPLLFLTLAYLLNADTGHALWFSPGEEHDLWTAQFLPGEPQIETVGDLFPLLRWDGRKVLTSPAPIVRLESPLVEVSSNRTVGDTHVLGLRLASRRGAPVITMDVKPQAAVRAAEIDGSRIENSEGPPSEQGLWSLTCFAAPPEGIEIELELVASQTVQIQVTDQTWELPDIKGFDVQPRTADMMPMPNFEYGTIVVTTMKIEGE